MPYKSEQPYCWHWKRFSFGHWRPVPKASLPLEWLTNYAKLDGLDATPKQLTPEDLARVLELAKELLRG